MTEEQERSDYEALKAFDHSAAMAAVIVLDAKRGDKYCIDWIKAVHRGNAKTEGATE